MTRSNIIEEFARQMERCKYSSEEWESLSKIYKDFLSSIPSEWPLVTETSPIESFEEEMMIPFISFLKEKVGEEGYKKIEARVRMHVLFFILEFRDMNKL